MNSESHDRPPTESAALPNPMLDRRGLFRTAGGVAALGGVAWAGKVLDPEATAAAADVTPDLYLGGTDGWIYLPPTPPIAPFHPDVLAPLTVHDVHLRLPERHRADRRPEAGPEEQGAALGAAVLGQAVRPGQPVDFRVQLTNLGLAVRPDLFDAHTLHWHGFRNVIPFFDGEPTGSVSVPSGRNFTYVYRPRDPGTYMYHCHVEDVEHVHMGMTGLVFVRPLQDGNTALYPSGKYLYNDGDGSTGFDREFSMFLSEVWAEAHWADAHIQLPEWSDYHADFSLLNGRVYPDTLAPNGSIDPFNPVRDASGDLIEPAGHPELKYQPHSSLVRCNAGERVAMRFANLGFREQAMTLAGLRMRVHGRDATPMRGRDGTDTSYETETINIGPGESFDVIFEAPAHSGGAGPDTYLLYNRAYQRSANLAPGGFGGAATEIRVFPTGTVGAQSYPNDWGTSA